MIKRIIALLVALSFLFLASCKAQRNVSGEILERNFENSRIISFVIKTDEGKDLGIILTDETEIWTMSNIISEEDFLNGNFSEVDVRVSYDNTRETLVSHKNEKLKTLEAKTIFVKGILSHSSDTLLKGTRIDVWDYRTNKEYRLTNGVNLLSVYETTGLENTIDKNYSALNLEAKKNIASYFDEQGNLYDFQTELEKAYGDYLKNPNSDFGSYHLDQTTSPTASSDDVFYCTTFVTLPVGQKHSTQEVYGRAFKKSNGEFINNFDLFSCPSEVVAQKLLDLTREGDNSLKKEMQENFKPEYLNFSHNNILIYFPLGSLPSKDIAYILSIDYDKKLLEILHAWAVPKKA